MLEPDLLTVSLCDFTVTGRNKEERGDDFFYLVEMKINKIMAVRNVAAAGQGRTEKCRAGYEYLSSGGSRSLSMTGGKPFYLPEP